MDPVRPEAVSDQVVSHEIGKDYSMETADQGQWRRGIPPQRAEKAAERGVGPVAVDSAQGGVVVMPAAVDLMIMGEKTGLFRRKRPEEGIRQDFVKEDDIRGMDLFRCAGKGFCAVKTTAEFF